MSYSGASRNLRFAGHNSFPLRSAWLKKLNMYTVELKKSNMILSFDENHAMIEMGVGKNMVKSILHWAIATTTFVKTKNNVYEVSEFGNLLLNEVDPYIENVNTIWMLHYLICLSQRCGLWCILFSILHDQEVSFKSISNFIKQSIIDDELKAISINTIEKDYNCILRSYVNDDYKNKVDSLSIDCPFKELGLILHSNEKVIIERKPRYNLSVWILLATLKIYLKYYCNSSKSIDFDKCLYDPFSPGQVFKLDKVGLQSLINEANSLKHINIKVSVTSGLKQVVWSDVENHKSRDLWLKSYEN